jgi:hypothetical protein
MLKRGTLLCLLVLTAYSAFAEKGLRFDLGADAFLTITNLVEVTAQNDGRASDEYEGGVIYEDEESTSIESPKLFPILPFIAADLYYQTSGEQYRFGFGGRVYSLIFASILIPSVYAELNLERFAANAQFGIMPMVLSIYIPLIPLPAMDISVSAWFKATERFKIGCTAMLILPISYSYYSSYSTYVFLPVCAVSLRWTLAGS